MRRNALIAILAAIVAGLLAARIPARAMSVVQPSLSTVQGSAVCSSALSANSLLYYDGTNWCGNGSPTINGITINPSGANDALIYSDSNFLEPGLFTNTTSGPAVIWGANNRGSIGIINGSLYIESGIEYAKGNTADVTNNYAPRMLMSGDWVSSMTTADFAEMVTVQPITFDNMSVHWASYTCSSAPIVEIYNVTTTTTLASFGLNSATGGSSGSVTPTVANVAAGDEVIMNVEPGSSCTTSPTVIAVGGVYHMQ